MAETYEYTQAGAPVGAGTKFAVQRYTIGADTVDFPVSLSGMFVDETTVPVAVRGDAANGLDVDVTRLPALPAGTNNIGDVDVLSLPATTNAGATAKTADYDTGAGTDTVTMLGLALPASGGAVAGGTSTNPVRIDPTGTTPQPVTQSGTWTVQPGDTANTIPWLVTIDELPAAAALADNTANPTVPAVGAFAMLWDGATWDRTPGTAADGMLVNLGANNDVTVTSGTVTLSGAVDTELPAAAALADNTANPTAPAVGAFAMLWDGATWDRAPGTAADGALVNLGANNDVTVTSGTVTANAGTNLNTSALALESGGNLAAAATSLGVMDGWDESGRAKINPIAGQAGVAASSGAVSATTQRVVLANAHGKTLKTAIVSLAASGNIVAAAGASKSIRVYAMAAQSRNDTMTLQVTDGSGGSALTLRWAFNTREGVSRIVAPPAWLAKTTDNTALYATITGTGTIDIDVQYWDDDQA